MKIISLCLWQQTRIRSYWEQFYPRVCIVVRACPRWAHAERVCACTLTHVPGAAAITLAPVVVTAPCGLGCRGGSPRGGSPTAWRSMLTRMPCSAWWRARSPMCNCGSVIILWEEHEDQSSDGAFLIPHVHNPHADIAMPCGTERQGKN